MDSTGAELLAAIVDSKKGLDEFVNLDLQPQLFVAGEELDAYQFIYHHVNKHGVIPTRDTLVEEGWELPKTKEPASYYLKKVEKRQLHTTMRNATIQVRQLINKGKIEPAFNILAEFISQQMLYKHRKQIVDFATEGRGIIKQAYTEKKLKGDEYGILTGWPSLDEKSLGMLPGDFWVIVGKTKAGKTYLVVSIARHAWWVQKKRVMIVSMEIKPVPLIHRLAALHTKVPVTDLNMAMLNTKAKVKFNKGMMSIGKDVPFYIIDGELTAKVSDIVMLARQLKPEAIYVDGAYMLQPSKNVKGWEAVVDTARGLKRDIAMSLNIPVFASYQFAKSAFKLKKNEELGLHNVAGSQEIPWLASILLGITDEETVENNRRKRIEIMAGRDGQTGDFWINWIFDRYPFMDFSEWKEPEIDGVSL